MNKSTIDFVNRIKSIRKEKGLSQIELEKDVMFLNQQLVE